MATGGTCYIFNSVSGFLDPAFASTLVPYFLILAGLSELIFCICLLIARINQKNWEKRYIEYNVTRKAFD